MKGIFLTRERAISSDFHTALRHYGVWLGNLEGRELAYPDEQAHRVVNNRLLGADTNTGSFLFRILDEGDKKVVTVKDYSPFESDPRSIFLKKGFATKAELLALQDLLRENPDYHFRHDELDMQDPRVKQLSTRIFRGRPVDLKKTYRLDEYVALLEEYLKSKLAVEQKS